MIKHINIMIQNHAFAAQGHSAGAQLAAQTVLLDVVRFIRANDKHLQQAKRTENGLRDNGNADSSSETLPRIEGLILYVKVPSFCQYQICQSHGVSHSFLLGLLVCTTLAHILNTKPIVV